MKEIITKKTYEYKKGKRIKETKNGEIVFEASVDDKGRITGEKDELSKRIFTYNDEAHTVTIFEFDIKSDELLKKIEILYDENDKFPIKQMEKIKLSNDNEWILSRTTFCPGSSWEKKVTEELLVLDDSLTMEATPFYYTEEFNDHGRCVLKTSNGKVIFRAAYNDKNEYIFSYNYNTGIQTNHIYNNDCTIIYKHDFKRGTSKKKVFETEKKSDGHIYEIESVYVKCDGEWLLVNRTTNIFDKNQRLNRWFNSNGDSVDYYRNDADNEIVKTVHKDRDNNEIVYESETHKRLRRSYTYKNGILKSIYETKFNDASEVSEEIETEYILES